MICPVCNEKNIPENARFCSMCGANLTEARQKSEIDLLKKQKAGIIPLSEKVLNIGEQKKKIEVVCKDITEMNEKIDLLTISAYPYSYYPTRRSLIGALYSKLSISVDDLAKEPLLDLRKAAGCWVSKTVSENSNIRRIGGVEIPRIDCIGNTTYESLLIRSFKSYMHLLDILTEYDTDTRVIAIPFLGTGDMHLNYKLMTFPLINEILLFLSRNKTVEKVIFVERNYEKAKALADCLDASYNLRNKVKTTDTVLPNAEQSAFISYADTEDRPAAEKICKELKEHGISYWFAPENIGIGDYASQIVDGIQQCTHFICIISKDSMKSPHVLNELDLAFQRVNQGVKIIPFRLDDSMLEPSFQYYLSRMQWKLASPPPMEDRIQDFINDVFAPDTKK